jgi:hypothetical protein
MFVRVVINVVFFMVLRNPGHLAFRTEFCGTLGHNCLKRGPSRKNRDKLNPYMCSGTELSDTELMVFFFTKCTLVLQPALYPTHRHILICMYVYLYI